MCDELLKISVIVPLYHGKKYLDQLHKMIREAANRVSDIARIEWVISNDLADEIVEPIKDSLLDVVVLNSSVNKGIQGARVTGLKNSNGEFVLFLDQDDMIYPDYFASQLDNIDNADAVVCNAIHDGKPMYPSGDRVSLAECVKKDFSLKIGCGFIPGQVLIRKEKIPQVWIDNWLSYNCCDDYYLWLCMHANGCVFAVNNEVLYEHIVRGQNQGNDSYSWYKSTMEMLELICDYKLFSAHDEDELKRTVSKSLDFALLEKYWFRQKYEIYRLIVSMYENRYSFIDCCGIKDYSEVAIYGAQIGIHIMELLLRENIHIGGIIDRNADSIQCKVAVYSRENIPDSIRFIINTVMRDERDIHDYLQTYYPRIKVISAIGFLNSVIA